MKLKSALLIILSGVFSVCYSQKDSTWNKFNWLIGEWVGEGSGQPGQGEGTFTFKLDLDKNILVRKSHSEYPAQGNKPEIIHDDLMIVYPDSAGSPSKAIYFDNEGHAINYTITFSDKSIVFISKKSNGVPVFRLTYTLLDKATVNTQFEMSQDGSKFTTYIEGKSKKTDQDVMGFGILKKITGQWNGPVYSSTSAGSFDKWYVDFRPVSAGQVSQYSMLDSQTVNITSFFIVKYGGQLKVAMRTEGCFAKKCCVTYEVIDSVNEASGYYRFSDFLSGRKRAYTVFNFKDDQYVMEVYTNKFNKVNPLQLHSRFEAKLAGRKAAEEATSYFNFPQQVMIKDFSDVFKNMTESIYFDLSNDPYNSSSQPYVGNITVNITIDSTLKTKSTNELCILLTTQPLFSGIKYDPANLNYLSKCVYLPFGTKTYTIKNVHPGKYYIYSYDDINNDKKHTSGDYMSSGANNTITLPANGKVSANTKIDYIIP